MSRVVQYEQFGDRSNLKVVEVTPPTADAGTVRVRVLAAGLNPVDSKFFHGGPAAAMSGITLPGRVGNDFAGVVDQVGEGVTGFAVGDAVLGSSANDAEADYLVVAVDGVLIHKPEALAWETAGALSVVARTASASVASLGLTSADTVLVSAAAGGVGVVAVQLAVAAGATVIGTASESNHEFLRSLGVVPVSYGEGLVDRVRAVAPGGITAALDNNGPETITAALELGAPIERINTIAAYGPDAQGATSVGGHQATNADLRHIAELVAGGSLVLPIDSVFPIEQVVEAYARLEGQHLRGKIVLVTE